MLISDARRGLTSLDRQLLDWYRPSCRPLLVLLTKSDKLGQQHAARTLKAVTAELASFYPGAAAQLFSAVDGTGVTATQRVLYAWLK